MLPQCQIPFFFAAGICAADSGALSGLCREHTVNNLDVLRVKTNGRLRVIDKVPNDASIDTNIPAACLVVFLATPLKRSHVGSHC